MLKTHAGDLRQFFNIEITISMWNDRKCRKSMFIPNRACFQHNSFLKILWLQPEDSFNQYNFSIYSTILLWILIYPVGCNKEVSMSNWLCVLRWRSFEQYYPHSVDQRYIFIVWNFKFHFINVEGNSIFERSVTIIKYTINIFHFRFETNCQAMLLKIVDNNIFRECN